MSNVTWSLQHKRDSAANFTSNNPTLLAGQFGIETDGLTIAPKFKIGDGVTAWGTLPYATSGGLTIGTSSITGGTNTRILYNNNGVLGEYTVTGTGTTAVLSTSPTFTTDITTPIVNLSGAISSASWTTNGLIIKETARNITNTTSSGTVAATYTSVRGGNTIISSSATTYTDYAATIFKSDIAGSGTTITRNWALGILGNDIIQGKLFITDAVGTAPIGPYDLEVNKSINGGVEGWIRNNTAGSAAFAQWAVRTDGTTQLKMGVLSSAYTTAGLLTAQTGFLMTAGTSINKILIGHQAIAKDIMFINGGTATTYVALGIDATKNVYIGNAALATTATDGFLYVTSCAGPPTGVPTAITGRIPLVVDSTNNKMYIYSGGAWVALN